MMIWVDRMKAVGLGFCVTVILMLIVSVVFSLLVYFTPLRESIYTAAAPILNALCLLAGGFVTGQRAKEKGALLGCILAVLLLLLMLAGGAALDARPLIKVIYCLLAGTAGGIIGVK